MLLCFIVPSRYRDVTTKTGTEVGLGLGSPALILHLVFKLVVIMEDSAVFVIFCSFDETRFSNSTTNIHTCER